MTRKELRARAREMKKKLNKDYDAALEKMIKSGCVDIPSKPSGYGLIKNFICAFCEDMASDCGYGPGTGTKQRREDRKEIANIRRFI